MSKRYAAVANHFFAEHPDDGRKVAAQFFADGLEVLLKSSSMRMANVAITSPLGFGHCRTVGKNGHAFSGIPMRGAGVFAS